MEDKLSKIFKKLFNIENFTDELSMDNLKKWDSLSQLTLIIEIETEFELELSIVEAIQMTCVKEIKRVLAEKGV